MLLSLHSSANDLTAIISSYRLLGADYESDTIQSN
jgi:hypothetical protein